MSAIKLATTGTYMPMLGLGTWKAEKGIVSQAVKDAIKLGYRHIDCACDYGNEDEIGEAFTIIFEEGVCKREDIFVTSKLWNTFHAKEHVKMACQRSLSDLKLDYLDLYLIHFPISLKYVPFETRYPPEWVHDPDSGVQMPNGLVHDNITIQETWEAMESLVEEGLVKNIGISNFNCALIMDLLKYAKIKPAVLQIENHPFLPQQTLVDFCHKNDIAVTAYSSFASVSYAGLAPYDGENLLEMAQVKNVAKNHGKSPAQILLRWAIERKVIVIPKSTKKARLQENSEIFDFELTDEDKKVLGGLRNDYRFNNPEFYANYPIFG